MQCQSYFPVCHSHYDLNADVNGGARPVYNGNGSLRNRHYSNYVSSSAVPQGPLAYGKEFVRQTMLIQEVTFRDQVQELHRLYRRQKELMSEIRNKELCMNNNIHLEAQGSNSFSSPNYGQSSHHNLPLVNSHCWPSSTSASNVHTHLNFLQVQKHHNAIVSNGGANSNLEPKGKKIGGKLLDLELPAEVYIDTEDQESLEDAHFCEPLASASSSNKFAKIVETNTNLADLNALSTKSLSEKSSKSPENVVINSALKICERSLQLVDGLTARSDGVSDAREFHTPEPHKEKHASVGSCQGTLSSNLGKDPFVVQALPCLTNKSFSSKGVKVGRIKAHVDEMVDANSRCGTSYDEARSSRTISSVCKLKESKISMSYVKPDHSEHVNGLNHIDLNSVVENTDFTVKNVLYSENESSQISALHQDVHSVDGETTRKSRKCWLIDINLPCDPIEDESYMEDDQNIHDCKNLGLVNLSTNHDGLPLMSSSLDRMSLEIDLEAPLSPEVEEGLPPRKEFEENQPEVTLQVAAEVIVSMSASKYQSYPDTRDLHKSKPSDIRTLEWFAGLIQSMSVDPNTNLEALSHSPSSGIDDFEAMTLNLTEMKVEEHLCQNNVIVKSFTSSTSQSSQMRKGRTRRSKRKDFQREVLPSLASLSRYEVTEDIQMIEGLMEAAGTPWQLSRTRRACRMGRKPRATEQQINTCDLVELKNTGVFVSWGKVPRRRRRLRSRPSYSKWHENLI